jgi:hypothetical protein
VTEILGEPDGMDWGVADLATKIRSLRLSRLSSAGAASDGQCARIEAALRQVAAVCPCGAPQSFVAKLVCLSVRLSFPCARRRVGCGSVEVFAQPSRWYFRCHAVGAMQGRLDAMFCRPDAVPMRSMTSAMLAMTRPMGPNSQAFELMRRLLDSRTTTKAVSDGRRMHSAWWGKTVECRHVFLMQPQGFDHCRGEWELISVAGFIWNWLPGQ